MARVKIKQQYVEGDWFVIPLEDGGFAIGLAARVNPKGGILGYFFGPRLVGAPRSLAELGEARGPHDALLVARLGDLGIVTGKWSVLGTLPGWNRNAWGPPDFGRHEELSGLSWRVRYDDEDPMKLLEEIEIPAHEVSGLPEDGILGSGAVELLLTHMLKE